MSGDRAMPKGGDMFHHYRIIKLLGKGGMGEVYLAEDTVLDRKVALKLLSESLQQDADARKRFLREAKSAAALDHPFICQVYDTGEANGRAFIAMEYIAGETLGARLARGPLPLKTAVQAACEIAEALEEAHQKGFVHRDLKPSNIMLTSQGHAKVMDFGLAKQIMGLGDGSSPETLETCLTQQGMIVGTLAYMSPEQARGEQVDARSDIFSFGVVLYELLSGSHPFLRKSQIDILSAILRDASPPLHMESTATPTSLSGILTKSMAKDTADRYQSMTEMSGDLRRLREQLQLRERPRWPPWAVAVAVVAVLLLMGGIWWLARRGPPPLPPVAHAPVSVLIADFENQTGEPVFDSLLEKALEIGLEGAPFISSYKRTDARKKAQNIKPDPGSDRLDRTRATLVANSEGINLVLSGSIEASGSGYRISAEATDPFSGKAAINKKSVNAGSKDEVLGAMASLAVQIRKALGDSEAPSGAAIARETFTAGSLEAASRYAQAQELIASGKWERAIEGYQSALALDPELGRAYAGLAAASANNNRRDEAKRYYQEAMKRIDRMTEREKHRTMSGYYLLTGDAQAANKELRALIERYPADEAGLNNLALASFFARNMAAAVNLGKKAAAIYPKSYLARGNVALFLMYAGDFDAAYAEANQVIGLNPGYETAHVCKAVSELLKGNPLQAEESYQKLAGVSVLGASFSNMGLADMNLYQGRLAKARSLLESGVAVDVKGDGLDPGVKLAALAGTYLLQGKTADAIPAANKAIASSKQPRVLYEAGSVFLEAGRPADALALAKKLDESLEPDVQTYAHLLMARIQLRRGNREGGIRELEDSQKNHDTWLGRYELGRAYIEAGAYPKAFSELDQCLKRLGEATAVFLDDIPTARYLPPLYYYLGRAQEGLGQKSAAASYGKFVSLKEGGQDPLLADARRRLSSLK
jgi:serine/threonine protein kinase/tetratricopeptide (TPR) repeat protein